ncbi:IS110 family transposase [Microbacterium sp. OR16]|uniref:IS110 family transposase n=1 Tax=Microbacterium sp. OR16 TaxID=3095345 RepID=UPI0039B446EC
MDRYDDVDVFSGLDDGKGKHHAVDLDRTGKRLFDRALQNDETRLRAVLDQFAGHGLVLPVVGQAATIGALPVAVAQPCGALVGYLSITHHRACPRRLTDDIGPRAGGPHPIDA